MTTSIVHRVAFGAVGVHRLIAELLLRHCSPYIPTADIDGVDLIVLPNVRVQVKTTRLVLRAKCKTPCYWFEFRGDSKDPMRRKQFHNFCDVVVLHGADENRFWIIPASLLVGKWSASFFSKSTTYSVTTEDLLRDHNAGLSNRQLGQKYGMPPSSIWHRLRRVHGKKRSFTATELGKYENKWEVFESCFRNHRRSEDT